MRPTLLHRMGSTEHDHVVAIGEQSTEDHILLPHQVDVLELSALHRGRELGDEFIGFLE